MSCRRLEEKRRNSKVDLRADKLFKANDDFVFDCCPSYTQLHRRVVAVNKKGLIVELFQTDNFTQAFYETACFDEDKQQVARTTQPCKFVNSLFAPITRCVQQWSYVYAISRVYGHSQDRFTLDYIRVLSGCKCQVAFNDVAAIRLEHHYRPNTDTMTVVAAAGDD